jgi:lactaldehyde dehydrogenase/glycolaldehyde dehydrogenase
MKNFENFINGKFVVSTSSARIPVMNPATGEAICTVPDSSYHDANIAIEAATAAQRKWAKEPAVIRAKLLRSIAKKIRERLELIARIITEEQG